jgi:hypothetical protein
VPDPEEQNVIYAEKVMEEPRRFSGREGYDKLRFLRRLMMEGTARKSVTFRYPHIKRDKGFDWTFPVV